MDTKIKIVINDLIDLIRRLTLMFNRRIEWLEEKVGEVYTNGVDN